MALPGFALARGQRSGAPTHPALRARAVQKIREAKQGKLQVINEDEKEDVQLQNVQQNLSQLAQNVSVIKNNSQQVNLGGRKEEELKQQNVVKQILFTVDAVLNLSQLKFPCGVLVSSNPPACLYTEQQIDNTARLITNFNAESPLQYPHFENSTLEFFNIKAGSTVVIDIRSVLNIGKGNQEIKEIGWSIFPVYQDDGAMNSGSFQIPIFKPPVSPYIIQTVSSDPSPWNYLMKMMKDKKYAIAYFPDSTMIVTIQPFALRVPTQRAIATHAPHIYLRIFVSTYSNTSAHLLRATCTPPVALPPLPHSRKELRLALFGHALPRHYMLTLPLLTNQIQSQFDVYKTETLQMNYLPPDKVKKLQWTADAEKKAFKGKKIKDQIGKQDPREVIAQTKKALMEHFKLLEQD